MVVYCWCFIITDSSGTSKSDSYEILNGTVQDISGYLAKRALALRNRHNRSMLSKPYVKPLPWCPVSIHATPAKGTVDATSSISHVLMYLDAPPQRKNSHSDSVPIPQLFNLTIKSFSLLLGGDWRE
jgi:hypothetical protein